MDALKINEKGLSLSWTSRCTFIELDLMFMSHGHDTSADTGYGKL